VKKSTLNIIRLHGLRIDRAAHNYIYFAFYDAYVKAFLAAGRLLARRFGSLRPVRAAFGNVYANYHAKVLTPGDARKIVSLDRDITFSAARSRQVIPFSAANRVVFQEPGYIAVMDCPCRLSRDSHCGPVNVCMAVGRTLAEFWLEHCARYNVRKVSQAEAAKLLEDSARQKRVITAWLKTETGGRTGVICSCCSCCCGGIEGMRLARKLPGSPRLSNMAPSGYSVELDPELCSDCGGCAGACAFDAVRKADGGYLYDWEACLGCGVCVDVCSNGARKLVRDGRKGLPLDVGLPGTDALT
jgi:Pyruvate/2-oxoacid:ferredoxin oxidoreductase delta subunit